jgi:homoserine kinase
MNEPVKVFAPATVANVGSGFDTIGFAISGLGDTVLIEPLTKELAAVTPELDCGSKISLTVKTEFKDIALDTNPLANCATVPMLALARKLEKKLSIKVTLFKNMPISSGLGSSAASAAAGSVALASYLNLSLSSEELIAFALEGEKISCSTAHGDNVAPSILGGITAITDYDNLKIVNVPNKTKLLALVLYPHYELKTADSRNVLPNHYERDSVVKQIGNVSSLLLGFVLGRDDLVTKGLNDEVATPYRRALIPQFEEFAILAKETSGCLGLCISGSGPSICFLIKDKSVAVSITNAAKAIYSLKKLNFNYYLSEVGSVGARKV